MKALRRDLGLMDYKSCWDLQQSLFDDLVARKRSGAKAPQTVAATACAAEGSAAKQATDEKAPAAKPEAADNSGNAGYVLLVEHPPVYTLGKSGQAENLLVNRTQIEAMGAQFFHIDRGGDITFHGPGQLVCYPILDLELLGIGLRDYIGALEEAVIRTVARYGIRAGRIAGASGVWIGGEAAEGERTPEDGGMPQAGTVDQKKPAGRPVMPRKICAIGVRSSRFVTMHGFALNVTTDLKWFSHINPCGFTDRGVTSIAAQTGRMIRMDEVKDLVVKNLSEILNVKIYNY